MSRSRLTRRTALAIMIAIFAALLALAWYGRFDRDWLSRLQHEALVVFLGLSTLGVVAWPLGLLATGKLARGGLWLIAAGPPLAAATYVYARDTAPRVAPTAAIAALVIVSLAALAWRDRRR